MKGFDETQLELLKKRHPNIDKIYRKDIQDVHMAVNSTMNLIKLQEVLNNEN